MEKNGEGKLQSTLPSKPADLNFDFPAGGAIRFSTLSPNLQHMDVSVEWERPLEMAKCARLHGHYEFGRCYRWILRTLVFVPFRFAS